MEPKRIALFSGEGALDVASDAFARAGAACSSYVLACGGGTGGLATRVEVALPAAADPLEFSEELVRRARVAMGRVLREVLPDAVVVASELAMLLVDAPGAPHPRCALLVGDAHPSDAELAAALASVSACAVGAGGARRVARITGRAPRLALDAEGALRAWLEADEEQVLEWRRRAGTAVAAPRREALRFALPAPEPGKE